MGSNVTTVGNWGGVLLGKYGVFAAGRYGNANTTVQWNPQSNPNQAISADAQNVTPANLSTANTPGVPITNGNYAGQGITAAFDSGPILFQQTTGWAKWGVMVRPDIPGNGNQIQGLSASVYGTYDQDTASGILTTYNSNGIRTGGNENWFLLPVPAVESSGDVATWKNPLLANGDAFWSNAHLAAIRINVTAITGGAVLFAIFVAV